LFPALRDIRPEIEVVSEKSVDGHCSSFVECESCSLLDPLDGTKEFIKGTNEFTINVALIESGQPVLGVIHAPALGLTYYGLRRSGAWRQTGDEPPKAVSSRRAGPSQVGIVAIKDHIGLLVSAMLARLTNPQLRSMGSSLKFCLVAGLAEIDRSAVGALFESQLFGVSAPERGHLH